MKQYIEVFSNFSFYVFVYLLFGSLLLFGLCVWDGNFSHTEGGEQRMHQKAK